MNSQSTPSPERTACAYIVGIFGCFLIVALLVWAMRHYIQPTTPGTQRAAERAKALMELRAAEAEALEHPGMIDPVKGVVRLPIATAMDMILRDWGKDPAAGRSNLISRLEVATAPAPRAPEKPSQFE